MNLYLLFILSFLIFEYLLDTYSKYLNIYSLKLEIPKEFVGIYDSIKYKNSQEYTIDNSKFNLVVSSINVLITFIFILIGGFNYLDLFLRKIIINNEIILGLSYFGILIFLNTIISLPVSYYSTFYIEEKYGFNKSSKKLFFIDQIKGLIISIIIGSIILSLILSFFMLLGKYAWMYSWVIISFFIILIPIIYVNWIAPLFNEFTKLKEGELKDEIDEYALKVQFPLKEIFIVDGSKRSSHSNAYFTGFGKNKRIVLYDTLLKNHSTNEIISIIAHEVGHYKKKHIIINTIMSIVTTGIMLFCLSFFIDNLYLFQAFQMQYISTYAGIVFFSILYSPINFLLSIFMNYFSRLNEYEADKYAVETIGDRSNLILALKNLSISNLSNLTPHKFYVWLNYSHPPVLHRIKAITKH
tara:strand:+ start:2118 stop:3353 length:1236 start_codon:yes stop_codon:yes gene_type:complete